MIKITVGFIVGIMVASAMAAQTSIPITDGFGETRNIIVDQTFKGVKLNTHLDEDELKAIKEACK